MVDPYNTALTAVYGLLGLRPIEQELDLRKLTLLGNILSQKSTLEYEIAQRQMSVKGLDSNSWFSKQSGTKPKQVIKKITETSY